MKKRGFLRLAAPSLLALLVFQGCLHSTDGPCAPDERNVSLDPETKAYLHATAPDTLRFNLFVNGAFEETLVFSKDSMATETRIDEGNCAGGVPAEPTLFSEYHYAVYSAPGNRTLSMGFTGQGFSEELIVTYRDKQFHIPRSCLMQSPTCQYVDTFHATLQQYEQVPFAVGSRKTDTTLPLDSTVMFYKYNVGLLGIVNEEHEVLLNLDL